MNLSYLTDESLLEDTAKLDASEKALLIKVLFHLAEIDRRKLFSALKYPSLYDFCLKELKYSEGTAQRRIVTCRLIKEIPEIAPKIKSGELTLTNVSMAVKFMRENNIYESDAKRKILDQIGNMSKKQCEQKLFEITGRERPKVTTITIMDQTFVMLQKTRDMLGGYLTNDQLLTKMAEDEISKIEKERFKQTHGKNSPPPVAVTFSIPAETKRQKYAETPYCENCGSTTDLEYEHRIARAHGGTNDPDNIRIFCRNCNERARIEAGL